MTTAPDPAAIAAIVVTFHTGPVLFDCLDRLTADPLVGRVIVVDNGNPADVSAALRGRGDIELVAGHGNIGFARACNLGAARARLPLLAFINPDALIEPGALAAMRAAGSVARSPWIVGARLVWRDGPEQRGARRDPLTLWSAFVAGSGLGRLEKWIPAFRDPHRERDPLPAGPIAVGSVSGAAMLMSRADFEALGGFDGGYFLHGDDIDLCRRAREAGGAVVFQPAARVIHVGSSSAVSSVFVARRKALALIRYFYKFARTPGDRIMTTLTAPFIFAMIVAAGAARDMTRQIARALTPR